MCETVRFYASNMAYPYEPGVWYSIGIVADVDTQTYNVEIGPCGEPRETLVQDASFRDDTVELSTWAVWSSQTAALEVSTPAWIPSGGCVPATCESSAKNAVSLADGCGGPLNCGGCEGNELCDSGMCVEELVTTPPPPACVPDTCEGLGIECGVRSDGCGDYRGVRGLRERLLVQQRDLRAGPGEFRAAATGLRAGHLREPVPRVRGGERRVRGGAELWQPAQAVRAARAGEAAWRTRRHRRPACLTPASRSDGNAAQWATGAGGR